jgi:pimeloyl-ACP methyl ester carboxylesterase
LKYAEVERKTLTNRSLRLKMSPPTFVHSFFHANGIRFHAVTCGTPAPGGDQTPILLLHGFPESWYSWRYLMPLLAAPAGGAPHKVVAIDMRGYHLTDKPRGVKNYRLPILARDVAAVIRKVSPTGQVYLVGHDWGGGIAWEVARYYPKRVVKLFVLNCPPVEVLFRSLFVIPKQLIQSYYIYLLQVPLLGELYVQGRGASFIRRFYSNVRGPDGKLLSKEDVETYVRQFRVPFGASGINYYRSSMRALLTRQANTHPPLIRCFTKVIWGVNDFALNVRLTPFLKDVVAPGLFHIKYIPTATHHVQQNAPEACATEILRHL